MQKHILHTIKNAGRLTDQGETPGTGEDSAFKLLGARLEPISSMDSLQSNTPATNHTCTLVEEGYLSRGNEKHI